MNEDQNDIFGLPAQPSRFAPESPRFASEPTATSVQPQQAAGQAHALTECPRCNRKLLSTRSILCNWCGARIDDPEYQERAAQERAALDAQLKDKIDQELAETGRFGVLGRLQRKAKSGMIPSRINVLVPPGDDI